MPLKIQNGFARDMEFEELEKTKNIHKYVLKSNAKTLEKFPFKNWSAIRLHRTMDEYGR